MPHSLKNICLLAVFSLALGVIWPDLSLATQVPRLEKLGQIKEGLRVPSRVDVDSFGNLFVADARLQQVFKFDKFGRQISTYDQVKASGAGLAVSSSGDRVYVSAFDKVAIYDAVGNLLGYLGKGAGEFVSAGSIDFDSDGNIYVADLTLRIIKVYSDQWSYGGQLGSVSFVASSSMAIDSSNDQIYVADSAEYGTQLNVYDRFGNLLQSVRGDVGFGSAAVYFLGGMTFDNKGRIYVSDIEGMTVRVIDSAASPLLDYNNIGKMYRPAGMVFDEVTGRLFVLQADQQVDIYGVDGAKNPTMANQAPAAPIPVAPIGGSEVTSLTPALKFNNAVDPNVTDELSYTIRVFDAVQQLVSVFNVAEQPKTTLAQMATTLLENRSYSWQVQTFDGLEVSAWTGLQPFYTNAIEETPSRPQLTAPLAGDAAESDSLLSWYASSDNDPYDSVRYRVDVASDADFNSIVFTQDTGATELALYDWSEALEPGREYYWRVAGIDNHGLSSTSTDDGRFSFHASVLAVTASMPGSKVYLGGHQGYAGQYVGEAPLELRGLAHGRYQVVVERAGFEPCLIPIDVLADERHKIHAQLQPALVPGSLVYSALRVAGKTVNAGSQLTPLVIDLDLDGVEDLLLATDDGVLHYYPGVLENEQEITRGLTEQRQITFAAEQILDLPQLTGAVPCLIDWNNDYQQDLVIGSADGSVRLFINQGDFKFAAEGQWLASVNGIAAPVMGDLDLDGDKDLVIGSEDGELVLFINVGSDAEPQLAGPHLLVTFADAAAPVFVDWDGDGQRELLVATEGQVYRATFKDATMSGLTLVAASGAEPGRLFALDIDGVGGKDLVVATEEGELLLAYSIGAQYVAGFYPALEEKLQQLQRILVDEHPVHLPLVSLMNVSMAERKLGDVLVLVEELIFRLPADAAAKVVAGELAATLK